MSDNDMVGPGMTRARYVHLERTRDAKLTEEELRVGWHFCNEWDDMLIHESWPEYAACTCRQALQ